MSIEHELRTLRQAVEDLRPLRQTVDDLGRMVHQLAQDQRDLSGEVDGVARNLTQLVRSLEQDDKLRDKAERFEEEERNRRHQAIVQSFQNIVTAVEKLYRKVSDLPKDMVDHVEQKIYDLRIARYEARLAGVHNEPALLPPVPTATREHTGKIDLAPALTDEADESIAPTPAQQRWLARKAKWLRDNKYHVLGYGAGAVAWLAHGWHYIVDLLKHATH